MQFNLEKIVTYPTWREMLIKVIEKENIDPWDIDIVKLTSKYIEYVRRMKNLELNIPANIILAASILLRMKSDVLEINDDSHDVEDEMYVEDNDTIEEIPILELKTRIPPKRRVTLDELVEALDEAFQKETEHSIRLTHPVMRNKQKIITERFYDIDVLTEELMNKMKGKFDDKGMLAFSSLLNNKNDITEKVKLFLPLIFLANKGKLVLIQEILFGDIIIVKTDKLFSKDG